MYMNLLDVNNRSKKHLLCAFLLMLFMFYFIYLSSIFLGTLLLFNKPIPNDLNESYFGFIAITEFISLIFFRTRTTIYFLPKMLITYQFIYLIYVHFTGIKP